MKDMSMISFEWGNDIRGNNVLLAIKKRGKISIAELQEAMQEKYDESAWAVVFGVRADGYQGWGEEPKGDMLELYKVDDWEACPICAATFCGIEFCPHCGERIKE